MISVEVVIFFVIFFVLVEVVLFDGFVCLFCLCRICDIRNIIGYNVNVMIVMRMVRLVIVVELLND